MTRQHYSGLSTSKSMTQRSLLIGLGLVSSISLLGSSMAQAQSSPEDEAIAVPSAEELLSIPAPTAAPASAPTPVAAPEPVVAPQPATSPAAVTPSAPQPETPVVEASPTAPTAPIRPEVDYSELYIDPTHYGIGATRANQPTVVLTERNTGCETALQPGQGVPSSICRAIQQRAIQQAQMPGADGSSGSPAGVGHGQGDRRFPINAASVQSLYNRTLRPLAFLGNGNTRLLYPLSIPASITSAFGWRVHPISGTYRLHSGTDIGAPMGTPVLAAFSGRVDSADMMGGYGLAVILTHDEGRIQTLYGHLSEIFVQPGEVVNQGDVIGRVGSTGNSTGPHLHFEYREYTANGWVAMDAGQLLQGAMAQFLNGFQVAKLPAPQLVDFGFSSDIKNLEDFGKLAADVLPEVVVASEKTFVPATTPSAPSKSTEPAAKAEDDLPEVVVPAVINH